MLLIEVFSDPIEWKEDTVSAKLYTAEFSVYDLNYKFVAERSVLEGTWYINFSNTLSKYELSNTGKSFSVFATILDIFRKFMKTKNPDTIIFQAKEPSRIKLYDRMAKQLERMGFTLSESKLKEQPSTKIYTFEKN